MDLSWIKPSRLAQNINQKEFAKRLDITPIHLSNIESDNDKALNPSVNLIDRIADELGFNLAVIIEDPNEAVKQNIAEDMEPELAYVFRFDKHGEENEQT